MERLYEDLLENQVRLDPELERVWGENKATAQSTKEARMFSDRKGIDALAEAWASIDGKGDEYRQCEAAESLKEEIALGGYYSGYSEDAKALACRLEHRGFKIVPLNNE